MRICMWAFIFVSGWFIGFAGCARPRAQASDHAAEANRPVTEVNLLAMGDWGMLNQRQKAIAETMKNYVASSGREFDALVTAGDNIYVQPKDVNDPLWQRVFEEMYDASVLKFPFYIAPGNHDYEHGKIPMELEYARRNPTSRWKFPSTYYRIDLPAGADKPLVTLLMLDSCRDQQGRNNWEAQMNWLRKELANPNNGQWLFCVAHHPLYSNGDHGDNGVLQREWGPLFTQHGVDLFICGHDHDLQHIEMPGVATSFILVGGGGASTRPMRNDRRGPFSRSVYGFADLQITPEKFTVKFVGRDDVIEHAFERTSSGTVRVIQQGDQDKAVPRTPRSISRPDRAATTRSTATQPASQP